MWRRHGLSIPALQTSEGRALFWAVEPAMALSRALGGPTLERNLLARHQLIDHLLAAAIDDGRVSQVLEVAAGLSARGWRFARRYGERLTYVEADLPPMARRKRSALAAAGAVGPNHRVADLDALRDEGPDSIAALAAELDRERGLAIVTEGLLLYLDRAAVIGLWARIAGALGGFPHGVYLSDLRLGSENRRPAERAFGVVLSAFVRGRIHLHFADASEAEAALREAGFAEVVLHAAHEHPGAGTDEERGGVRGIQVVEATS